MRTDHSVQTLSGFPIYSSGFVGDNKVVLGGGGGAGRSGVKNKLRLYEITNREKNGKEKELTMLAEKELEKDEDAPMTIATHPSRNEIVCGINSSTEKLEKGQNENCRVFKVENNEIVAVRAVQTIQSTNGEEYQKVTAFSKDRELVAVGGTDNSVSLLTYPSLATASKPFQLPTGELYDADFSSTNLLVAGTTALYLLSLPSKGKSKQKARDELKVVTTTDISSVSGLPSGFKHTFRAARFNPESPETVYAIVNTSPLRSSRTKGKSDVKAYLVTWTIGKEKGWEMRKPRVLSGRPVTVFDVSENGKLLAYGSSDCSVGMLDAKTLAPLVTILKSHDFPPTTLRFNPSSTMLISGSADNTVRIINAPEVLGGQWSWTMILLLLLAFIMILIAAAVQYRK